MVAVIFATLSGLSYGASDFSGGLASRRTDSTVVTLAVQVVSLMALGVVLVAYPKGVPQATDLAWGALAGLGVAVGLSTFYKALANGPMSTAASVTALVGSLIPVVAGLVLGHVPSALTMAGVVLAIPAGIVVAIGGAALVGGGDGDEIDLGPRSRVRRRRRQAETRRLAIVAGCGFGFFFVALAQTSSDGGLNPLLGARFGAIAVLVTTLMVRSNRRAGRAGRLVGGQAGLGGRVVRADIPIVVVAGLLDCSANSFYLLALGGGSLTWVAAVVSLYPVATVLLARVVLAERIARIQTAGLVGAAAALVLVGVGAQ